MCYLGIWLQCRFRVRPEGLHFWQAPRGQWCSWLEDHTLGLTGEENIYKLAEDTRLVVVWPLPASPAPSPFLRSSYPRIPGGCFWPLLLICAPLTSHDPHSLWVPRTHTLPSHLANRLKTKGYLSEVSPEISFSSLLEWIILSFVFHLSSNSHSTR